MDHYLISKEAMKSPQIDRTVLEARDEYSEYEEKSTKRRESKEKGNKGFAAWKEYFDKNKIDVSQDLRR